MDILDNMTAEDLRSLVRIYARNIYALDGVWFQSVEGRDGMDVAMFHDCEVWRRFTVTEARRIKKFLELPEHPGLDGLEKALAIRFSALANPVTELYREDDSLVYRVVVCRVQAARVAKGMPYHPCASAGIMEHEYFARAIDDRIVTRMESCYPEITDHSCACSWRFSIDNG